MIVINVNIGDYISNYFFYTFCANSRVGAWYIVLKSWVKSSMSFLRIVYIKFLIIWTLQRLISTLGNTLKKAYSIRSKPFITPNNISFIPRFISPFDISSHIPEVSL